MGPLNHNFIFNAKQVIESEDAVVKAKEKKPPVSIFPSLFVFVIDPHSDFFIFFIFLSHRAAGSVRMCESTKAEMFPNVAARV